MGDIADMMIEGAMCQQCGEIIGDGIGDGYPVICEDCTADEPLDFNKSEEQSYYGDS